MKRMTAKLGRAIHEQNIVRVERTPRFADALEGFLLAVGSEWALMAQCADGGYFDGYVTFRLDDVERIAHDRSFQSSFAMTQPEWPPSYAMELDLNSTRGVLEGLGQRGALIGIQKDAERSAIWIGELDEVQKRFVYLHEVRPDASWRPKPLGYKLKAITTVEVGTRYLMALAAVSGAAAASRRPIRGAAGSDPR